LDVPITLVDSATDVATLPDDGAELIGVLLLVLMDAIDEKLDAFPRCDEVFVAATRDKEVFASLISSSNPTTTVKGPSYIHSIFPSLSLHIHLPNLGLSNSYVPVNCIPFGKCDVAFDP